MLGIKTSRERAKHIAPKGKFGESSTQKYLWERIWNRSQKGTSQKFKIDTKNGPLKMKPESPFPNHFGVSMLDFWGIHALHAWNTLDLHPPHIFPVANEGLFVGIPEKMLLVILVVTVAGWGVWAN